MSDRARLSARVDAEVMVRVVGRAKVEGRSVSNMIERLLLEALDGGVGSGAVAAPLPYGRPGVAGREFKPDFKRGVG